MRILLIPAKSNYPDPKPSRDIIGQAFPYLAGVLKSMGHEVTGSNFNHLWCHENARTAFSKFLCRIIQETRPDIVGLGGLSADYLFIHDAIACIRNNFPDLPIMCGGGIISGDINYVFPLLRPDFAVIGEGEEVIGDLISALEHGKPVSEIEGIAFWKDNESVINTPRKPIKEIDSIPLPDYEPFDFQGYLSLLNQGDNYFHVRSHKHPRLMPVLTARSCPFHCSFCYHTTGRTYRQRKLSEVIREIGYFHSLYNFNILKIYDELFSHNEERVRKFCQDLKALHLNLIWSCSMRVDNVNEDILREMKSAGCMHIAYGFESASPAVIESMQKKITLKQIRNAIEITEKVGIGVQANFIFGDCAETVETVEETKQFYDQYCRDHIVHCDYITPYPGSAIFSYCVDNQIIRDKKKYYEGICYRPRINMTGMSYRTFYGAIEPIVNNKYAGFQSAKEAVFTLAPNENFDCDAPLRYQRSCYTVSSQCPHCRQEVSYLFPLNRDITPLTCFCHHCHKRFLIPRFDMLEEMESYKLLYAEVSQLQHLKAPVVIAPVLSFQEMSIRKFYGFDYENLNIASFLDFSSWPEGSTFLSFPVFRITNENIGRFADCAYVVLPCSNQNSIVSALHEYGIQRAMIYIINDLVSPSGAQGTLNRAGCLATFVRLVKQGFARNPSGVKLYNALFRLSRLLFPRPI
jgi:radical SAM superfamily enzyme YgiQ (UPF0313 family)